MISDNAKARPEGLMSIFFSFSIPSKAASIGNTKPTTAVLGDLLMWYGQLLYALRGHFASNDGFFLLHYESLCSVLY